MAKRNDCQKTAITPPSLNRKLTLAELKCPPNPFAIRAIVFRNNNLSVINGPTTEIAIPLSAFSIPVGQATRTSFTLPGRSCNVEPMNIYRLDLGGVDLDGEVKFIALLPNYGTNIGVASQDIDWTYVNALSGTLVSQDPVGPSATTSFDALQINGMEFGVGATLSLTGGTGPMWIASNGGLLQWDGSNMLIWNSLNSPLPSDTVKTLTVDAYGGVWMGTDNGIIKLNLGAVTPWTYQFTAENSDLLSNNVQDIQLVSVDRVAMGTDAGLSIYNFSTETWKNFDAFNTPALGSNDIRSIAVSPTNVMYIGTSTGVYLYDAIGDGWGTPFNSSVTPGWSAPNAVQAVTVFGSNLYIGTTGGLVIAPLSGATAQTIVSTILGPISSDFQALRVASKSGYQDRLYCGHPTGFSVLGLQTSIWEITQDSLNYPTLANGVKDLLISRISGSSGAETIFMGNTGGAFTYFSATGSSYSYSNVPSPNNVTNLLYTFPDNDTKLYSTNQDFYFEFAKPMTTASFEAFASVHAGITGMGATVAGTWAWSNDNRTAVFAPAVELDKASPYFLHVAQGSTAADNTFLKEKVELGFYTEDIIPILGWNTMGKIMMLSGSDNNLTQGIYLRNHTDFDIEIIALIGR